MDIATSLGLVAGATVVATMMLMGGDLRMFVSDHAIIIIFGGSFAATLIRFPLTSIFPGLPLGAKFAFTMRRISQRELVDEIAGLAEIARKQGPLGLEKVEVEDPYLAKGIRFVADGYDAEFIRDNLERDREFPHPPRRGAEDLSRRRRLRARFRHGRHAHRHGADVRQHDRSVEA